MAERIAVMNKGHIEQVSPPTKICDHPHTLFVNQFVGPTNLILGELSDIAGSTVRLADGAILTTAPVSGLSRGARVVVSVRPEQLRVHNQSREGAFAVTVTVVLPVGPQHRPVLARGLVHLLDEHATSDRAGRRCGSISWAFMASFDNVPVSLFLADERTEVLPIHLWQQIETNLDLRTAAVSGLIVIATIIMIVVAERFAGLSRQLAR